MQVTPGQDPASGSPNFPPRRGTTGDRNRIGLSCLHDNEERGTRNVDE